MTRLLPFAVPGSNVLRLCLLLALSLGLGLLGACGGGSPKLAKLPADAVILAFGDSLTFGTGANTQERYPAALERLAGRKVVAAGVPGEVSAAGLARLPAMLDQVKPALLVLCHGGNDFLRKLDEAEAAKNVRAMVQLAKTRGIAVVLIGTPKSNLFPSPPGFYADNELKSDLVHPNAKGYARLAEAVADLLKSSGAL